MLWTDSFVDMLWMVQPQSDIKEKDEILEVALGKGIKIEAKVCHQGFSALTVLK